MALTRSLFTSIFSLFILEILAAEDCDKSKCLGPIRYYEDIKCTPIYNSPEDCCPYKYNCDHLHARSPKKCYINGHEYEIRESLKIEDAHPCSKGCFCSDRRGIASFTCAIVDCFTRHSMKPNCYHRRQANRCCPGEEVCPEKAEDRPTCEVDGKIYKDGENFKPASEPHKNCYCGPGYTEDEKDTIIKKNQEVSDPDKTCKFGNLVMNYGDEISQPTGSSVCVKCVCDVGPTVTCLHSPNMQC
ncbi:hypothetical protein G9C98_001494 [Cotesia typhae]|uniref:Kielin/chordin-like protein n=1 Tax=Cotesia typhae TaxID=2053667 RepID=A0A8J5V7R9_9HYME|nr:hypothetical protein G9C98_001494 [Cotesia typhae]